MVQKKVQKVVQKKDQKVVQKKNKKVVKKKDQKVVQKHCPKKSKKRIDKKNCPIVQGSDVLSYAYIRITFVVWLPVYAKKIAYRYQRTIKLDVRDFWIDCGCATSD